MRPTDGPDTGMHEQGMQSSGRAGGIGMREPIAHIRDDLATLGSDVAEAGRRAVQSGTQAVSDTAQAVGVKARDATRAVCDFASDRPGTALLITLGAGILIGSLFLRGRH